MSNEMIETIEQFGIDKTAELLAEYLNQKILSEDVAMQFILEEIEAASQGNEIARLFAETSGFDEDDYKGAMYNSFEEVDGEDGPQQEILNLCMMLYPNQMLMTELRIKTVDLIMKYWELGKYASIDEDVRLVNVVQKKENHAWGLFANIMNDLGEYSKEYGENDKQYNVLRFMAYAYARRTVAAGLYLQGYWNRENYMYASNFFKSAQLTTGQSFEFQEDAAKQANELLTSYDYRLTKNVISKMTTIVALEQVKNPYDNNKKISYEELIKVFYQGNWKETLIRDLIILTAIDGDMDEEETNFVNDVAINKLGFSEQKIKEIMSNLDEIEDFYPTGTDEKLEYILDLIQLAYVDGLLDDSEINYMKIIAERMNFSQEIIDQAILSIEESGIRLSEIDINDDEIPF